MIEHTSHNLKVIKYELLRDLCRMMKCLIVSKGYPNNTNTSTRRQAIRSYISLTASEAVLGHRI